MSIMKYLYIFFFLLYKKKNEPSDMLFIFSKADAAVLKGLNAFISTTWLNLFRSGTELSTCGKSIPTSSNSLTLKRPYPAACSNSTNRGGCNHVAKALDSGFTLNFYTLKHNSSKETLKLTIAQLIHTLQIAQNFPLALNTITT